MAVVGWDVVVMAAAMVAEVIVAAGSEPEMEADQEAEVTVVQAAETEAEVTVEEAAGAAMAVVG